MKWILITLVSVAAFGQNNSKVEIENQIEVEAIHNYEISKKENEKASKYAKLSELTFLNGFNFDFEGTKNKTGYIGNVNVFFPISDNLAINSGLRKVNYSSNINGIGPRYQVDSLKIRPLDIVSFDSLYVREYNKYTSSVKISCWSAYFQVMHKIYPKIKNLYVHGHLEFLISDVDYTTEVSNIQRLTLTASGPLELGYRDPLETKFEKNETYFGFYVGFGLTGDFEIKKTDDYQLNFWVQGTVGFTNNKLNPNEGQRDYVVTEDPNPLYDSESFTFNLDPEKKFFHLIHTTISNKFDGVNILLGSEIRGIFDHAPLYIFYVGLNTDLKKVAELFKS